MAVGAQQQRGQRRRSVSEIKRESTVEVAMVSANCW